MSGWAKAPDDWQAWCARCGWAVRTGSERRAEQLFHDHRCGGGPPARRRMTFFAPHQGARFVYEERLPA